MIGSFVLFRWRTLLTWVAALACVAGISVPAFAHGRLKSASPGPGAHLAQVPNSLRLDFSESPDLSFTTVRLFDASGREIPLDGLTYALDSHRSVIAVVRGTITRGTYTVMWQMAGDDGHPVRGRYEFVVAPGAAPAGTVPGAGATAAADSMSSLMHHDPASMPEGNGFGADSAAYVAIRWLQFVAILLVIGAVSFRFLVLGFLRRDSRSEGEAAEPPMVAEAEQRAAHIGHLAALVLAVTLVLRLVAQSYAMHGSESAFSISLNAHMLRSTVWGHGWLLQLVGIVLVGAGYHGAKQGVRVATKTDGGEYLESPVMWWRVALIGVVIVAFSPAFSGHAASAPKFTALAIAADGMHVLAASSWLGSLTMVVFAGLIAIAHQPAAVRGPLVRSLINAFSPVALASAGLAATTGLFAAWLHVGTIPNLWSTRYGITLLIKLSILGVVTFTGFYNWRFVKPRLGTEGATLHLQRSARVEVAVALLVLAVTAVLVASPTSMDMVM